MVSWNTHHETSLLLFFCILCLSVCLSFVPCDIYETKLVVSDVCEYTGVQLCVITARYRLVRHAVSSHVLVQFTSNS